MFAYHLFAISVLFTDMAENHTTFSQSILPKPRKHSVVPHRHVFLSHSQNHIPRLEIVFLLLLSGIIESFGSLRSKFPKNFSDIFVFSSFFGITPIVYKYSENYENIEIYENLFHPLRVLDVFRSRITRILRNYFASSISGFRPECDAETHSGLHWEPLIFSVFGVFCVR